MLFITFFFSDMIIWSAPREDFCCWPYISCLGWNFEIRQDSFDKRHKIYRDNSRCCLSSVWVDGSINNIRKEVYHIRLTKHVLAEIFYFIILSIRWADIIDDQRIQMFHVREYIRPQITKTCKIKIYKMEKHVLYYSLIIFNPWIKSNFYLLQFV